MKEQAAQQYEAMVRRHKALPNPATAGLPVKYEQACSALAACERLDECKQWADKAAALASYAKQADDPTLEQLSMRIKARAIRRCGELLQTFDARGAHRKSGSAPTSSQRRAAAAAGMSKDQQVTAVRVASVPPDVFAAAVDRERPATVQALAEIGKHERPRTAPSGFKEATQALGKLKDLTAFCREHAADFIAGGLYPYERRQATEHARVVHAWLTDFLRHVPDREVQ